MKIKSEHNVSVILGRLLFIGFSTQIVFGIVWMICNFGYLQLFGDTAYYVSLSSKFRGDGDVGILYPALLLLARALGELTNIPWYSIVYVLQLVLAGFAGYILLRKIGLFGLKTIWLAWGSLVVITFPPLMQINMAVLPNSLILSLFMLEAAMTISAYKTITRINTSTGDCVYSLSGVAIFWLLLSLTKWEYMFIGAIPVIAVLVRIIINDITGRRHVDKIFDELNAIREVPFSEKTKKKYKAEQMAAIVYPFICAFIFFMLIFYTDRLVLDESSTVRQEFSADKLLFERMAWKSRFSRESTWLLELTAVVDEDVMIKTSQHQENVKLLFEPALEEAVGEEKALELIRFTNDVVWNYDRKEFLHDLLIDSAGYVCPQVMITQFLEKTSYDTYTSRNYDVFKRNTPIVAKYYVDYSYLWNIVALIIVAVILVIRVITKTIKNTADARMNAKAFVAVGVTCLAIVARNVMQGSGVYDYKDAGSAIVFWFMAVFVICGTSIFDEAIK